MWAKQCEHCDIYRDKPCDCCNNDIKKHDKRKTSLCKFECKNIEFCKKKEVEVNEVKHSGT